MLIKENTSLLPYNTFGINVKTDYYIEYGSEKELIETLQSELVKSNKLLPIGEGSNLLFLNDYHGVILRSDIKFINIIEENDKEIHIEVGSGIIWDNFVSYCVNNHYYGVENLSLIPGQTGAAAVQNIGAYGMEVKDVISNVRAIEIETGKIVHFTNEECEYAYRESIFKNKYKGKYIITTVTFRLSKLMKFCTEYKQLHDIIVQNGNITLQEVRDIVIKIREEKLPDPKQEGNAGSFFKNPIVSKSKLNKLLEKHPEAPHYYISDEEEKLSAAWLIDKAGWKGKSISNAGVSKKQPLVLINCGTANGKDIAFLASEIQKSIKEIFDVELHPEVNYIK